jgi:sodium/hydrogen exchanger 8
MFEAGFSLKANIFFRSFMTISAYAVLATFIASIIFTLIFYYGTSYTHYPFFFIESFQFGCFISAIDPVATISIFKSLRVSEKLYMIVFGESALNDAVAIALAQSAESVGETMSEGEAVNYLEVAGAACLHFTLFFFGSMLAGALCGILVSYIFAKFDFHLVPWIEIGLFFILSYFPYVLAEGLGLSGILAILIAAIFMRNYAFHSLSPIGQVTVESMVEMTCNISENFVFAYMGLSVPITLNTIRFELIGIGVVALLTSRTISVLITSYIINLFKKDKIPLSYQAIMSFSGLRGAVAFYLALNVNSEFKHLIITTTIALIIITIVGLGSTTTCLLKAMAKYFPEDGIFHNEEGEDLLVNRERGVSDLSDSLYERNFEGRGRGVSQDQSIGVITRLEKFDMDYGRKFLRKDGWEDFIGEQNEDDNYQYDEQFKNSPDNKDKGKYYDNLSNYQMSVRKYMDETVVNLPYEDRKSFMVSTNHYNGDNKMRESVRLSMMSQRNDPNRSQFLNPNRKRVGSNTREDYERQMQMSKRESKPYTKSMRGEQMSVMSEPRGAPRGLRGFSPKNDDRDSNPKKPTRKHESNSR